MVDHIVKKQKKFFYSGETRSYAFRKKQLMKMKQMIQSYESEIYDTLQKDLNKSKHEALTTEIGILYTEINFALKHLKKWMEQKRVQAPLTHKGTESYILYEPYGVTLIIAPWNYPVQLALAPAIGAIAAGNTVVLKPSELTMNTSNVLHKMIKNTFEPEYFTVVEGDKNVSEQLLEQRFDYIFFTGSTQVGKIVMKKASNYLTPVTLELGGKSPAIVDHDCNVSLSAKRIAWGKYTNAGQTCVAPDYLYVHEKIFSKFMKRLTKQIRSMYGKQALDNNNYVTIVNEQHFNRLLTLMEAGKIALGGKYNREKLKIEPTVIEQVTWKDPIMKEEIFGPILPVLTFTHIDEVIKAIQHKEKPLALYYFGSSRGNEELLLQSVQFGGGCINDTLYHLANPHLPFGGVGQSGIGAYHGKYSFETFSHRKSMLRQTTKFDLPVRYPGGKLAEKIANRLLK